MDRFFFPLFGGSGVEEIGIEKPVANPQFLQLLFLPSSLKIALLADKTHQSRMKRTEQTGATLSCKTVYCPVFPPHE